MPKYSQENERARIVERPLMKNSIFIQKAQLKINDENARLSFNPRRSRSPSGKARLPSKKDF
jgi:hypothetical protein